VSTIQVEIVSAEQAIWSGTGTMVFAPAQLGEVGIAPKHAPLLTPLKPGEVRVQQEDGDELFFYVSGGLMEIQPTLVTVLSDTVVRAADLNEAEALEAQRRAERDLADKTSKIDLAKAQADLAQAVAQLRAIERVKKRRR